MRKFPDLRYTSTSPSHVICTRYVLCAELKGGVTSSSLEDYGPCLITHCVAKWLVDNKIPAEFIAQLPSDPHDLPDGGKQSRIAGNSFED